jgi:hypothetical protein
MLMDGRANATEIDEAVYAPGLLGCMQANAPSSGINVNARETVVTAI